MVYMPEVTTIQVEKKILNEMKKAKRYPRQTYSELIHQLLKKDKEHKNQYDEYLHKIQQEKMTELWDNREDEEWENA
ncbi:MAG: hypothetical protein HY392_05520 [Candidatus Diapherotrites archaeon]|nr:hypothetical protein [Candidatus Diapherotrites archaeon]